MVKALAKDIETLAQASDAEFGTAAEDHPRGFAASVRIDYVQFVVMGQA
jgi:hypothetical protein